MRHYLVVANETLDDPAFDEWVARRLATEPVHVHLVVPPNRTEGRIRWNEQEATDRARRRLARARPRPPGTGIPALLSSCPSTTRSAGSPVRALATTGRGPARVYADLLRTRTGCGSTASELG